MSFDWHQYLDLAFELADVPDEAKQRTSISRAYYCAYHAASRAAKTRFANWSVDSFNRHTALWNCWAPSDTKPDRRIGNMGLRLKEFRLDADYNSDASVTRERTHKCLEYAKNIITAVDPNRVR